MSLIDLSPFGDSILLLYRGSFNRITATCSRQEDICRAAEKSFASSEKFRKEFGKFRERKKVESSSFSLSVSEGAT